MFFSVFLYGITLAVAAIMFCFKQKNSYTVFQTELLLLYWNRYSHVWTQTQAEPWAALQTLLSIKQLCKICKSLFIFKGLR